MIAINDLDPGILIANDHHFATLDDFDFVAERDLTWEAFWGWFRPLSHSKNAKGGWFV